MLKSNYGIGVNARCSRWQIILGILPGLLVLSSCEELDTIPPSVLIVSPAQGSFVSEIVEITCVASDNVGVESIELWIDGLSLDVSVEKEPYSMNWSTTEYAEGSMHVITLRAIDAENNRTDSDPITVTIDNSAAYPSPVGISSIMFENGGFTIQWDPSVDADFASYELKKSVHADFSDSETVISEGNILNTSFIDLDIDPLTYQYYRVAVIDQFGFKTPGPITSSTLDPAPGVVEITSISSSDAGILIQWEESEDGDFQSYELLYSEQGSAEKISLATYLEKSSTAHLMTDYGVMEYSFWIEVSDSLGQTQLSSPQTFFSQTAFQILTTYMLNNDLDAPALFSDWIISASAVAGNEDSYFILDIRAADRFTQGHIQGAVNCIFMEALLTVEAYNVSALPILVVDYTGQSSAFVLAALRLSGYSDAKILKWGMSGWHSTLDSWSGGVGSIAIGHSNWVLTPAPTLPTGYDAPEIITDLIDGAAILAERVDVILHSFQGVTGAAVLETPSNYEIISYLGQSDYDYYGHLTGAYQVTPSTLTIENDALSMLDPSQTFAILSWTGQTESLLAAWLVALGYDAKVVKMGMNGLIYDSLESHKWIPLTSDYDIVVGG